MTEDNDVEWLIGTMLVAIDRHGEETGHDVGAFSMPRDFARPKCPTCCAVMFDGPALTWEADA